jgi:hypothetical protein
MALDFWPFNMSSASALPEFKLFSFPGIALSVAYFPAFVSKNSTFSFRSLFIDNSASSISKFHHTCRIMETLNHLSFHHDTHR